MSGIQYYDAILKKLKHPQENKIRKIILLERLEYVNNDLYICKPIQGYNKTAYTLRRNQFGLFSCNCQGYNKRGNCSHSTALGITLHDKEKEKQGVLL